MNFLMVGLGGALGSISRYAISMIPVKTQFPFVTLIINLIGSFIIGFVVGFSEFKKMPSNTILFLKTGFCGGFTTFSTFSLEAYNLLNDKAYGLCVIYSTLSLAGCIAGVLLGKKFSSAIFA